MSAVRDFIGALDDGIHTQNSLAVLAVMAAQFVLNAQCVELVGLAATGIEFTPQG